MGGELRATQHKEGLANELKSYTMDGEYSLKENVGDDNRLNVLL